MPSLTKVQTGFLEPQGAFELTPGTSSSPGLFFTGNTSTGMFSPSSGVLGFSTGSTQNALAILANGYVGIGITDPISKLHVANSSTEFMIYTSSGNLELHGPEIWDSPIYMRIGASYDQLGLYCSDTMHFNTSNTGGYVFGQDGVGHTYIKANGNVGIGTTNPTQKLEIYDGGLKISRTSTYTGNVNVSVTHLSATDYGSLYLDTSLSTGGFVFRTGGASEKVRITGSGNVGIGTTNPLSTLHVQGTLRSTSQTFLAIGETTTLMYIGDPFTANTRSILFNRPDGVVTGNVNIQGLNAGVGYTDFSIQAQGGNVGIGTTNPLSTLHVVGADGQIYQQATRGTGRTWRFGTSGTNAENFELLDVTGEQRAFLYGSPTGGYSGWEFLYNGNVGIKLNGSGNVGIGTTNPVAQFHIGGTASNNNPWAVLDIGDEYFKKIHFSEDRAAYGITGYGAYIGYDAGVNTLTFGTYDNSVEYRVLNIKRDTGNVGIGTGNPGYKLDIIGAFRAKDNNSGLLFQEYNSGAILWLDGSDGDFAGGDYWGIYAQNSTLWGVSYAGGTNILNVTSSGNVGIGTTNPSSKLHVSGVARFNNSTNNLLISTNDGEPFIYVEQNAALAFGTNSSEQARLTTSGEFYIGSRTAAGQGKLFVNDSSGTPLTRVHIRNAALTGTAETYYNLDSAQFASVGLENGSLVFRNSNSSTPAERFRISSTGNVGIGTTNPAYKFEISQADYSRLTLLQSTTGKRWQIGNDGSNFYVFNESNAVRALDITSTGNVGIGTNPAYKLDVNGDVRAERYRAVNSLTLNSYQTVNPGSNVFLYSQPNDRDSWIYLDSADTESNWGIYHRQIDSTVNDLPGNSIGFIGGGNNQVRAYISLWTGNGYFSGNVGIGITNPTSKLHVVGTIVANNFMSDSGTSNATASGSPVVLFTLPNENGTYIVTAMVANTNDAVNYHAVSLIGTVAPTARVITTLDAGGLLSISLNGADVRATQNSGANQFISWSYIRIAVL